mmetsp:Transcript_40547/g.126815  ORF Transcript_40547/g.126815 Transcript_40547/m.126815 type:complete len:196 (+) Transcript_40547:2034-2621(+)
MQRVNAHTVTVPKDETELLDNQEQQALIDQYKKDAKEQEQRGRRLFGGICLVLGVVWLAVVFTLVHPDSPLNHIGFTLSPLRRLPIEVGGAAAVWLQCVTLTLQSVGLLYVARELRALRRPRRGALLPPLAAAALYWTLLLLASGGLAEHWKPFFILVAGPTLIFALVLYIDGELASLVRDVAKLDRFKYNYEKP